MSQAQPDTIVSAHDLGGVAELRVSDQLQAAVEQELDEGARDSRTDADGALMFSDIG